MKVCIIGLGFVGSAMYKSFENKGLVRNYNLFAYDKYKDGGIGRLEDVLIADIIFLALPTCFDELQGTYNKDAITETCDFLSKNNYSGLVVIKSTVEPETIDNLNEIYEKLNFVHNPEFLTARTAYEDFHNQKHIVLGKSKKCSEEKINDLVKFYSEYYPDAEITVGTSLESESMKIFCNSFYAVKVQFFTELYLLTKSNGSNYENIVKMMLKNDWINPAHTNVPGPDGNISYGGLCFPKDTNALNKYMEKNKIPNKILESCIKERNQMRHDNCNILERKNIVKTEIETKIVIETDVNENLSALK